MALTYQENTAWWLSYPNNKSISSNNLSDFYEIWVRHYQPVFKMVTCHNPLQMRLPPPKSVWCLQLICSWELCWSCTKNTAQGWHWSSTRRLVWRLIISHYHYRQVIRYHKLQFADWNSLKGISKSTQRWKSLCQFISHLWFIIRKCKTVSLRKRYSLLDPAGAFQDQRLKST